MAEAPPALPSLTTPPSQGSVIKTHQLQAFPRNVLCEHILYPTRVHVLSNSKALLFPISEAHTKFRELERLVAIYNHAHRGSDWLLRHVLPTHEYTVVMCQGFLEKVPRTGETDGQNPLPDLPANEHEMTEVEAHIQRPNRSDPRILSTNEELASRQKEGGDPKMFAGLCHTGFSKIHCTKPKT